MAHDVFISYSSKDRAVADEVRAALEGERVRCWVAPRDVLPGVPYGQAIIEALNESRALVLIYTANSNASRHVMREVERAVNKGVPVISFRLEDVPPSPSMEYFISSDHWLDALTPPLESHTRKLVETIKLLRGRETQPAGATRNEQARHEHQPAATRDERRPDAAPYPPPGAFVTTPLKPSPAAPSTPFDAAPHASPAQQAASARGTNRRALLVVVLVALACVAVLGAALTFFVFGGDESPAAAEVSGASVAADAGAPRPAEQPSAERPQAEEAGDPSKPRLVLGGHTEQVRACAFSPDGKLVASGGDDKAIRLWDAETGELRQTLDDLDSAVLSLAFSPDGRLLAVALDYDDGRRSFPLSVFAVSDGRVGEVVQTLSNAANVFSFVAFSADGKLLLGGTRPAKVWDTRDWSLKHEAIEVGVNPAFALSPDGRTLATGGTNENTIQLWDAETGDLMRTIEGHDKGVLSLDFSPDGRTLASGSYDDTARLWDARTGEPKLTLEEERLNAVFSVAFSPDGQTVASGSYHNVKLWDARTGALKRTLGGDDMGITYSLSFSPDGRTLAGAGDKSVKLWDVSAPS
jgi:hypothetical protein